MALPVEAAARRRAVALPELRRRGCALEASSGPLPAGASVAGVGRRICARELRLGRASVGASAASAGLPPARASPRAGLP